MVLYGIFESTLLKRLYKIINVCKTGINVNIYKWNETEKWSYRYLCKYNETGHEYKYMGNGTERAT